MSLLFESKSSQNTLAHAIRITMHIRIQNLDELTVNQTISCVSLCSKILIARTGRSGEYLLVVRMFRASLAAAVLLMVFAHAVAAAEIPAGWRHLKNTELADPLREKSRSLLSRASADFNGDGIDDHAVILRSRKSDKEALWVNVSRPAADARWIKLVEFVASPDADSGMAIDATPPGTYPYGCFDNAKECDFGARESRPKLRLRDPSLVYFKLESASSLFFWSRSKQRFMRVWLSD